ncbi:MAG: 50S ribosome-binding GTPase [Flaviflexus sp.]|uniref:GTPase n=1 Tax=Flaviflexus sp. TaxID=1969482 RepID=UPI00352C84CA
MTTLNEGLHDLSRAIEIADGKVAPELLERARALQATIVDRQSAGLETTVVALFGATGSGKSSLFNALARTTISRVAASRPTTSNPLSVSEQPATDVLNWLEIPERHVRANLFSKHGDRIVLLDMPDVDSTEESNRAIAQKLAGVVDVLVWVLDPQKYADAVVHEDYLRVMSEHSDVTLVVLNQIDTVDSSERQGMINDAQKIVREDGLDATIIATSARTGEGIDVLRSTIEKVAGSQQAAYDRMAADMRSIGADFGKQLGTTPPGLSKKDRTRISGAVADAAGVEQVSKAAAGSYRFRGRKSVGWPALRWLRNVRVDPLKGLHLVAEKGETPTLTGVRATPAKESQVRGLVRTIVGDATEGLPAPWRRDLTESSEYRSNLVLDHADRIIAKADLGYNKKPAWWSVMNFLQWLFFIVALVGLGWLIAIWAANALVLPLPDPPKIGEVPLPPLLFLGGLLVGLILSIIGRIALNSGAKSVAKRVRKRLVRDIAPVTEEHMLAGVDQVIDESIKLADLTKRLTTVGKKR